MDTSKQNDTRLLRLVKPRLIGADLDRKKLDFWRRRLLYAMFLIAGLALTVTLSVQIARRQTEQAETIATTALARQTGVPAAAHARGTSLAVGVNDPFAQVNPLYASGDGEHDAVALIFEPLFRISDSGAPVEVLAESWQYDALTQAITVRLRPDHTFRDGRVVAAADVIFTYNCLLSSSYDGPLKGYFHHLEGVTSSDSATVTFHFTQSASQPDFRLLTIGIMKSDDWPIDLDQVFIIRDQLLRMEGSGSYALTELQENQAVLQLRPGYGGQINRVQLLQVASEAKFRLLQEGKLDIVRNLWDVRMQQRVALLGGYATVPFSTSVDSYLLVNPEQRPDLPINKPSQRLALLLTIAGRPLSNLQQSAFLETGALVLYYFQGVEDNVRYENRRLAEELAAPLIKAGLTVSYSAVDWPELAQRATTFDYDLLLLPAPTNNRLPDQVVLLDDAITPDASALVARYRDEVYLVCHRLAQLTINPNGHPFAAAKGSWTDRIENIRVIASGDSGHEEDLP